MHSNYEISNGILAIEGDLDTPSIFIPISEIGNELLRDDAFINAMYRKFKRIEQCGAR